jgi:hypothetical protein
MNNHYDALQIAEAVRAACLTAALESYEDAGMRGLCHEGAWECAIGAIRSLNLHHILAQHQNDLPPKEHGMRSS